MILKKIHHLTVILHTFKRDKEKMLIKYKHWDRLLGTVEETCKRVIKSN